jgi:hypothetical protein
VLEQLRSAAVMLIQARRNRSSADDFFLLRFLGNKANMRVQHKILLWFLGTLVGASFLLGVIGFVYGLRESRADIHSFEECAAAGYPILDSYPEQCETPDGKRFVRELDEPADVIAPFTISGMFVCLPHRNTDGPITLECAFGLRDDNGDYYALRDADPMYGSIGSIPTDAYIEVSGTFKPGPHEKYQSIGTIEVEEVLLLDEVR